MDEQGEQLVRMPDTAREGVGEFLPRYEEWRLDDEAFGVFRDQFKTWLPDDLQNEEDQSSLFESLVGRVSNGLDLMAYRSLIAWATEIMDPQHMDEVAHVMDISRMGEVRHLMGEIVKASLGEDGLTATSKESIDLLSTYVVRSRSADIGADLNLRQSKDVVEHWKALLPESQASKLGDWLEDADNKGTLEYLYMKLSGDPHMLREYVIDKLEEVRQDGVESTDNTKWFDPDKALGRLGKRFARNAVEAPSPSVLALEGVRLSDIYGSESPVMKHLQELMGAMDTPMDICVNSSGDSDDFSQSMKAIEKLVVAVHGYTGNRRVWREIRPYIHGLKRVFAKYEPDRSDDYGVDCDDHYLHAVMSVCMSVMGSEHTVVRGKSGRMEYGARQVDATVRALGLGPDLRDEITFVEQKFETILLGHSMGGNIVLQALMHRDPHDASFSVISITPVVSKSKEFLQFVYKGFSGLALRANSIPVAMKRFGALLRRGAARADLYGATERGMFFAAGSVLDGVGRGLQHGVTHGVLGGVGRWGESSSGGLLPDTYPSVGADHVEGNKHDMYAQGQIDGLTTYGEELEDRLFPILKRLDPTYRRVKGVIVAAKDRLLNPTIMKKSLVGPEGGKFFTNGQVVEVEEADHYAHLYARAMYFIQRWLGVVR